MTRNENNMRHQRNRSQLMKSQIENNSYGKVFTFLRGV